MRVVYWITCEEQNGDETVSVAIWSDTGETVFKTVCSLIMNRLQVFPFVCLDNAGCRVWQSVLVKDWKVFFYENNQNT